MKARREYSVNKNRNKLQEVLPLLTPYTIWIDVCDICNFRCKFCSVQNDTQKRSFERGCMPFPLFVKCIDDLMEFKDKLKVLRLTGVGEPLLNKHFPEMIRYAKNKGCADLIESVSNGSLLTKKLCNDIIDAGLDKIRFSIEATNLEDYKKMGCNIKDWDGFIDNFRYLYEHKRQLQIYMKIVDASVDTKEKETEFFNLFGDYCDKLNIENISPVWVGYENQDNIFAYSQEGVHGEGVKEIRICPDPFYSCIIHSNGDVGICCSDWERIESIGNVKDDSLTSIWMGEKHRELLMNMLVNGRRNCSEACKKCDYPNYRVIDDIDKYSDIILENFKRIF